MSKNCQKFHFFASLFSKILVFLHVLLHLPGLQNIGRVLELSFRENQELFTPDFVHTLCKLLV